MPDRISLTQKNLDELMDAFEHYFPENTVYSADEPFSSYSGEYNWNNRQAFIDYVKDLTGVIIKNDKDKVNIHEAQKKIVELVSGSPTEAKTPEANTLTPEQLKQMGSEAEERSESWRKARENTEKRVEISIENKREAWARLQQQKTSNILTKTQQQTVLAELKGKVVYAIPKNPTPVIVFTENEAKMIQIAKSDPRLFYQKLSNLIIQKNADISAETLEPLSQIIAADATQSLTNPANKPVPAGVFVTIADTSKEIGGLAQVTQDELARTASVLTVMSANQEDIYRTVLTRTLGENITNSILGLPQQEYILSDKPTDGAFSLKLDRLQNNSFALQEKPTFHNLDNPDFDEARAFTQDQLKNFAFSKAKSFGSKGVLGKTLRFTNSKAFDSIAPFLGVETNFSYVGTNFFGKTIVNLMPRYAPLITNLAGKLGIDIGISAIAPSVVDGVVEGAVVAEGAKVAGQTALGTVAKQSLNIRLGNALAIGTSKLLGKLGFSALSAKIGAAVGTGIVPVIGTIIGAVLAATIGKILEKLWPKIKKYAPYMIGAVIGTTAYLIAGPFIGMALGIGAFAIASAVAAGTVTTGAIAATVGNVFFNMGRLIVSPIILPFFVTLLVTPIIIALILFIINSGAYVVPPTTSAGGSSNPYIGIEKVADPAGPFENSDLPLKITYTITITAKKSALTDIKLEDECQIISADGTGSCPSDLPSDVPSVISPSNPYTFTYTVNYPNEDKYKNSLITDTIKAAASTAGETSVSGSGSASIVVGSPPTGCFTFDNSWNSTDKARETAAIAKISKATVYVSTLCSGGTITLHRSGSGGGCSGGGGEITGAGVITIYDAGVNCSDFVTYYTLAHETGHIYAQRTNKLQLFEESGVISSEGMICTYPNALTPSEDFAEMIALYYTKTAGSTKAGCMSGTLKDAYTLHWKWAQNNIFMNNLDW